MAFTSHGTMPRGSDIWFGMREGYAITVTTVVCFDIAVRANRITRECDNTPLPRSSPGIVTARRDVRRCRRYGTRQNIVTRKEEYCDASHLRHIARCQNGYHWRMMASQKMAAMFVEK